MSSFKLLTTGNPKIIKGQKQGYLTFILHLAPSRLSGYQTCPLATRGCASACLNTAGRGGMIKLGETTNIIQQARIRKTRWFFENRPSFLATLVSEIESAVKYADSHNLIPAFRLNGTSDIRWETVPVTRNGQSYPHVFAAFSTVQFYDYTKLPNRRTAHIRNYHLTFSLADGNDADAQTALSSGVSVAVVFRRGPAKVKVEKSYEQKLAAKLERDAARQRRSDRPRTKRAYRPRVLDMSWLPQLFMGYTVVNGDASDLRFLDVPVRWYHRLFGRSPAPVIVGLKAKGQAMFDTTGFVRETM